VYSAAVLDAANGMAYFVEGTGTSALVCVVTLSDMSTTTWSLGVTPTVMNPVLSPDGAYLYIGDTNNDIVQVDTATGAVVTSASVSVLECAGVSSSGDYVFTGAGRPGVANPITTVDVWEPSTGGVTADSMQNAAVFFFSDPSGRYMYVCLANGDLGVISLQDFVAAAGGSGYAEIGWVS